MALALLVAGSVPQAAAGADAGDWIDLNAEALTAGSARGIVRAENGNLAIAGDAVVADGILGPTAVAESTTHHLRGPSQLSDVRLQADVADGTAVEVELRGLRGGQWTEWRASGALDALDGATAIEVRTTLLANAAGASPIVRSLRVRRLSRRTFGRPSSWRPRARRP
jgi:hypothetical protein